MVNSSFRVPARAVFALLATVAFLLTWAAVLTAQTAPLDTISGSPLCSTCTITVTRVATLGRESDAQYLNEFFPAVVPDGRGGFLATAFGGGINHYDSAGTYQKTIGGPGQGPGEFDRGAVSLWAPDRTTLYVLGGLRFSVLDSNYREVGRLQLPGFSSLMGESVVVLPGGAVVGSGVERAQGARTSRALQADSNRLILRAWAAGTQHRTVLRESFDRREEFCLSCIVFDVFPALQPNQFWMIRGSDYSLWRRRLDLSLVDGFVVQGSEWFRRARGIRSRTGGAIVPIMRARVRPDSLMVVSAVVPASGVTGPPERPTLPPGMGRVSAITYHVLGEANAATVFEVIDPARGVLASTTIEQVDLRLISPDYALRYRVTDSGVVQIEIWRVEFRR